LKGLTFVFTGVLESLERDDATNLVKRYGGKVTGAPSSKTSYVVLGNDAGPKKIETIRKNNIPTISEDGLFQLIRTLPAHGGTGKVGQQAAAKKEAEEKKIMEIAKEMEAQAKQNEKVQAATGQALVDSQLWTEKYMPTSIKDICGNKSLVEKLQRWLHDWFVIWSIVLILGRDTSRQILRSRGPTAWGFIVLSSFLDPLGLARQRLHTL
jgi:replication factor C subunit 1